MTQNNYIFPPKMFILVMESDPDEMYSISEELKKKGGRVLGAIDEKDFWEIIGHDLPDCIILDAGIHDENLQHLIVRLRGEERTKAIPVIATVYSESEKDMIEKVADVVVKKPCDAEALALTVERAVKK